MASHGHIPQHLVLSRLCQVLDRIHDSPSEIPCVYRLYGLKVYCDKLKELVEGLSSANGLV